MQEKAGGSMSRPFLSLLSAGGYMEINTVIFDLDGTILNTAEDLTDSLNSVLIREGYPARSIEETKSFTGEGYGVLLKRALPSGTDDEVVKRCEELFRNEYSLNLSNKTRPYKGILPLFQELKNHGIRIGVVSNKRDEATKEVCLRYFGGLVDAAIGDNKQRERKPSPDNLYEAIRQLDTETHRAVFVGDSDIDVKTAGNADVRFIGVSWGYRSREVLIGEGADYIIDEPCELLTLSAFAPAQI